MLTKELVKTVHADIQAALQQVAAKHGLALSPQSKVKYSHTTFQFSAEFGVKLAGAEETDPKLVRNAERFGTYLGMSSRDQAIVKAKDGKMYRFKADVVSKNLQ